jgi:Phosphorylase superfamily
MRGRDGEPSGPRTAVTVLVATRLEARAVRRAAPDARVVVSGIGLRRLRPDALTDAVIVCGVAGALRRGVPTGTLVIPQQVLRPDGSWLVCDPVLADALHAAARRLGLEPERGPLATTSTLVRGPARAEWAARGCVAADMETGLVAVPRIAAVRAILDAPGQEISAAWQEPVRALLRPALWREAVWLGREAPRCARRAALVLATALEALRNRTPAPTSDRATPLGPP